MPIYELSNTKTVHLTTFICYVPFAFDGPHTDHWQAMDSTALFCHIITSCHYSTVFLNQLCCQRGWFYLAVNNTKPHRFHSLERGFPNTSAMRTTTLANDNQASGFQHVNKEWTALSQKPTRQSLSFIHMEGSPPKVHVCL